MCWLNKHFIGFAYGVAGVSQLSSDLEFAERQSYIHHTLSKEPEGEREQQSGCWAEQAILPDCLLFPASLGSQGLTTGQNRHHPVWGLVLSAKPGPY